MLFIPVLLILDSIYLSIFGPTFRAMIENIQGSELKINYIATALCYLTLLFAFYYFIHNSTKPRFNKIIDSFVLGLVIYSVYETTSHALVSKWDSKIALIDT